MSAPQLPSRVVFACHVNQTRRYRQVRARSPTRHLHVCTVYTHAKPIIGLGARNNSATLSFWSNIRRFLFSFLFASDRQHSTKARPLHRLTRAYIITERLSSACVSRTHTALECTAPLHLRIVSLNTTCRRSYCSLYHHYIAYIPPAPNVVLQTRTKLRVRLNVENRNGFCPAMLTSARRSRTKTS